MKIKIPRLEFYITNECNLACNGCNRFNNVEFQGHQRWEDYADIYAQWGKIIDVDDIVVTGGEPTLNPELIKWIYGLRRIWARPPIQVFTNGTTLEKLPELYRACQGIGFGSGVWIGVSIHHQDLKTQTLESIRRFLNNDLMEYRESLLNNGTLEEYHFVDALGVKVMAWVQTNFAHNSLIKTNNEWTLHNSNPTTAHNQCSFATFKSYHMIQGQLHKCGPAPLFAELDRQFGLKLSDSDRQLIHNYRGYTVEDACRLGERLIETINKEIPQCKFCPEQYQYSEISLEDLRSKIK